MESRADAQRWLVTLTIDPSAFGAVRIGSALWDDGRETALWSEPTRAQFNAAAAAMSKAWDRWMRALNARARRAGLDPWGYFRVVELHRNVWPHYHVVLEHPTIATDPDTSSWPLGISDVRAVSIDDAVGEVAPYLVSSESKGKGHKAYQFAAAALPKGFRLYSPSRGFLGPVSPPDGPPIEPPEHALVLRGHFTGYHQLARDWGAESRLLLPTPAALDRPHRPPSACLATGDGAVLLYVELADADALHVRPNTSLPSAALCDEGPAPHRAGTVPTDDPAATSN
jgi:hypothetical protein